MFSVVTLTALLKQKHEIVKKDLEERERVLAGYYGKEIDNPMILPAGEYKDKQRHFQQQWRDECRDYYSGVKQCDLTPAAWTRG